MTDHAAALATTVHVGADGAVTRGVHVPRATTYARDPYMLAATPLHAKSRRFAPGKVPAGVDQHLPCRIVKCGVCTRLDIDRGVIL